MALVGALLGCGDDERFLSLKELCPERAVDICEARMSGCCPGAQVDPAACETEERVRCQAEVEAFVAESGLSYDAARAARQRAAVRDALDACDPVPTLAQFFEHGAPLGTPCERDVQCGSGHCEALARTCAEPVVVPLCAPLAPTL